MKFKFLLPSFAAVAFVCGAAHSDTLYSFNFDNDAPGTSTAFTDTSGPLSATFSSSADPGGFVLYPSIFETLTGNVLGDPGPAFANNLALAIAFNENLSAITLNFATADFSIPSSFTLTAYENSTLVGSATTTGQFLPGFTFPEGEIAFRGPIFNNVLISTTASDFAVDNITAAAAPEPGTIGMLAVGLFLTGLGTARRRKSPRR